jgi:hypothetical protein
MLNIEELREEPGVCGGIVMAKFNVAKRGKEALRIQWLSQNLVASGMVVEDQRFEVAKISSLPLHGSLIRRGCGDSVEENGKYINIP